MRCFRACPTSPCHSHGDAVFGESWQLSIQGSRLLSGRFSASRQTKHLSPAHLANSSPHIAAAAVAALLLSTSNVEKGVCTDLKNLGSQSHTPGEGMGGCRAPSWPTICRKPGLSRSPMSGARRQCDASAAVTIAVCRIGLNAKT